MDFKAIMLRRRTQTPKSIYCMASFSQEGKTDHGVHRSYSV